VARVPGFLEKKPFKEGDQVKAEDLLFQIEPEGYKAAYDAAQGNYLSALAQRTQAQLTFQRTSDLYAKKAAPKSDFDQDKAALDVADAGVISARAQLTQAELNLKYASVKAPFDGKVSDSTYSEGAFVGANSAVLATLVSTDPVTVTFGIPDRFLADRRFGSPQGTLPRGSINTVVVKLRINGQYDYKGEGSITYLAPLLDESTDTVKVKASFPNPDGILVPGEVVEVIVEDRDPREVILVPKNSVLISSSVGSFVYVTAPPSAEQGGGPGLVSEVRKVTRGIEFPGGLEITEGLTEGDKIINLGLMASGQTLRPGTPLEVVENYQPLGGGGPSDAAEAGAAPASGGTPAGGPPPEAAGPQGPGGE
jgi:membrane fusion protein (multidrug efflux system)